MKINYIMDKSVQELKEMFPNSKFFEEKFDNAVMGVMPKSNRIVYNELEMIEILMYEMDKNHDALDTNSDEWCELNDLCFNSINRQYEHYKKFSTVKPKICRDLYTLCRFTFERQIRLNFLL